VSQLPGHAGIAWYFAAGKKANARRLRQSRIFYSTAMPDRTTTVVQRACSRKRRTRDGRLNLGVGWRDKALDIAARRQRTT
jgi:hypothetical protein